MAETSNGVAAKLLEQFDVHRTAALHQGWLALGYASIQPATGLSLLENYLKAVHPNATPPWSGLLLWRFYQYSKDKSLVRRQMAGWYAKITEQHQQYYNWYDPLEEGLPALDGRQDPRWLTALTWSNESLLRIGHLLGEDVSAILHWHELTIYTMNAKLWDEACGAYRTYDLSHQTLQPAAGLDGFLPLAAEVPVQAQAERMLHRLEKSLFTQPISLLDGWLLWEGLRRYELRDCAMHVRRFLLKAVHEHGFYETFDGATGLPVGSAAGPLAAALYLLLSKAAQK
ncbi:MAG TPA: hypothetical protein PKC76_14245 [Saprospiraceae bacterium]|nr:hypothetical protein [Saprospiraceae bacterium]HMP25291.1 hypothetical protein [Saprospiraceae bacterium]